MDVKVNKDKFWLVITNGLLLIICIAFLLKAYNSNINDINWANEAFFLSILTITLNLISFYVLKVKISEFQFVIMFLMYPFMYGRIWLHYLNLDEDVYWSLHKLFSYYDMRLASVFCVCCTQALFLGMILNYKKYTNNLCLFNIEEDDADLFNTGLLMLMIGLPCRIITDINSIITTQATGSIESIASRAGLADDFAYFFIPAILFIMIGKPKIRKTIFLIVCIYYVIVMSVTGDRRYYVTAIVAMGAFLLFLNSDKTKNVKWYKWIFLGYLALVFVNFLEVIRKMRLGGLVSFVDFVKIYGADIFFMKDLLMDILTEFGISFFSVVAMMSNVEKILGYQYGMSFIRAIPTVFPIGGIFGIFFDKGSPSTFINTYTGLPVGATIFGDMYANFGYLSILGIIILGVILSTIFNNGAYYNKFNVVIYYTEFYILINLVRCTFFEIVRPIVWCMITAIFLYQVVLKKKDGKE